MENLRDIWKDENEFRIWRRSKRSKKFKNLKEKMIRKLRRF